MDFLTLNRHNSFQNKNNKKATHIFAPSAMYFKLEQENFWFFPSAFLNCNFGMV